VLVKPDLN